VQLPIRPARADSLLLLEDGWIEICSTATIWTVDLRARTFRTVFQIVQSLSAAHTESAWRGDSGLPAPIRSLSEP